MKKLSFIVALLCASTMAFAIDSEYCGQDEMASGNNLAAFRWQTTNDGSVTIDIIELFGGAATATHFRNNGLKIANLTVGGDPASDYFNIACTGTKQQVVLSLIDANNAPAQGAKIIYNQVVEYATSQNGDAWPTLSFEYSYGGVCSSTPELSHLYFGANKTSADKNEGVELNVIARDQMGNVLAEDVEYTISPADAGSITDDVYTPSKFGKATITATVGSLSKQISILCVPSANLALNKTVVAGYEPGNAGEVSSKANDGDTGTQWVTYSDQPASKEWWYVDLGTKYNIDVITVLWGNPYSTEYIVQVRSTAPTAAEAADDTAWDTISVQTGVTINSEQCMILENIVGRYVRIHSVSKSSNFFRLKEVSVYGTEWVDDSDTEKPVMTSASLVSTTYCTALLNVAATDNHEIDFYHVVDAVNGIDQECTPVVGQITVTGLKELTTYNFTITAIDGAGNESDNSIDVTNVETPRDIAIPDVAAPVPTRLTANVLPIYCDAYDTILAHDFDKNGFAGAPLYKEKDFSGNHCLVYDVSSYVEMTWGMYDDGNRAIIALPEYRAAGKMGIDASAMDSLHLDIFSIVAMNNIEVRVCDNLLARINLTGEGWQSIDIDLSSPVEALVNINNVRWMKFTGLGNSANRQKLTFDNVYFYKEASVTPTSIDNTNAEVKAVKVIENGQLVIIKNGVKYNVLGGQL